MLMQVGLHFEPHGYARSLARYAANLGPVAWKIASKKLRSALPDGIAFGPGWVGEDDAPAAAQSLPTFAEKPRSIDGTPSSAHDISRLIGPSSSGVNSAIMCPPTEQMIEAVRRFNSQSELAEQGGGSPWNNNMSGSSFPGQQKPVFHAHRNGYNPMFGYEMSSQLMGVGLSRLATSSGQSANTLSTNDGCSSMPSSSHNATTTTNTTNWGASHHYPNSHVESEEVGVCNKQPSYLILPPQQRQQLAIPPDLNVRVQTSGSPSSSSLQIGSPQQPDLALQL